MDTCLVVRMGTCLGVRMDMCIGVRLDACIAMSNTHVVAKRHGEALVDRVLMVGMLTNMP